MSDREFGGKAPSSVKMPYRKKKFKTVDDDSTNDDIGTDDLQLPKATVQKILSEILPSSSGLVASKDYRDALAECSVEFITLIASEANEISEKEAKKTIGCEHITAALKELGFDNYIGPVLEAAEEHRQLQATREKKQSKIAQSGLSEEELIRQQQELFRSATDKFNAGAQESKE